MFGLGKKRVELDDYYEEMLNDVFSQTYDRVANNILDECPSLYRENIDRDQYLRNLRAVALQLLGVAFMNCLSYDQNIEVVLIESTLLENTDYDDIKDLSRQYNTAFGSDPEDGVRAMATLFVQNCNVSDIQLDKVLEIHHDAFYAILNALFKNIKSVKIV